MVHVACPILKPLQILTENPWQRILLNGEIMAVVCLCALRSSILATKSMVTHFGEAASNASKALCCAPPHNSVLVRQSLQQNACSQDRNSFQTSSIQQVFNRLSLNAGADMCMMSFIHAEAYQ